LKVRNQEDEATEKVKWSFQQIITWYIVVLIYLWIRIIVIA
jgi:hypothetical protein